MKCLNCKNEISSEAKFCSFCGKAIKKDLINWRFDLDEESIAQVDSFDKEIRKIQAHREEKK